MPLGLGTLAFLGTLLGGGLVGWLAPPAIALLLAVGAGILGSAVVLERHLARPRLAVGVEPPAVPAFTSAFVCAKCAEYTPPPDWAALLEATPAGDGRAADPEEPISLGPAGLPASFVPPPSWVPTPAAAGEDGTVRDPRLEVFRFRSLDRWIDREAAGLLVRTVPNAAAGGAAGSGMALGAEVHCATCRIGLGPDDIQLWCTDCARPICEPCQPRTIEHADGSWCLPCAMTRVGAQLLEPLPELDAPSGPAPGDLVSPS